MSQTPEIRILLQYKASRRSSWTYEHGVNALLLDLAQQWKRPVREIKQIIRGPGWDPAVGIARYHEQQRRREESELISAQVQRLLAVGCADEARALFYAFHPEARREAEARSRAAQSNS